VRADPDTRTQRLDLLAYLFGLGLGLILLIMSGYADWSADAIGRSDFAKFWAGPRALLIHLDPYDARTWHDTAAELGATAVNWPDYGYFGWTIVLLLPFALLPLAVAFGVWTIGGLAVAALGIHALVHRSLPGNPIAQTLVGMTLVASQPARLTVLLGQWGFVLCAALAATVVWTRAGRSRRAGIASLALLAKPQLFVLAAPALALWAWQTGRRRTVAVALAGGGVLIGLSIVLMPRWPAAWLRDIPSRALSIEPQTTTLTSVLYGLVGQPGTWLALAIIAGCALVALAFDPRGDAWLAAWLPLSLVAAPYVWSYDQTLLVVPLVLGAGVVARRSRRGATGVTASGAFILLVLSTALAVVAARRNLESYSAIIPVLVFALLVIAMWPSRRTVG
jgi:Glycosyltransferase family 87